MADEQNEPTEGGYDADARDLARRWLAQINKCERHNKKWIDRADKIIKRFRDDDESIELRARAKFNVLWSNVKTLQPAIYARTPKPQVTRRYDTGDPTIRLATQILERSLIYLVDETHFDEAMKAARDDYLLPGRGTVWVRYVPEYGDEQRPEIPVTQTDDGLYLNPRGDGFLDPAQVQQGPGGPMILDEPFRPLVYERLALDFVSYKDFLHDNAPTWPQVKWIARRVHLTKSQAGQSFGREIAARMKFATGGKGDDEETKAYYGTAEVYEIWDKERREVVWVSEAIDGSFVKRETDPLGLREFWPCPMPIWATLAPGSLTPIADYVQYQDSAAEMDTLTGRIEAISTAIRVSGVYNANVAELGHLLSGEHENKLIPSAQWAVLAQNGGLKGQMDFLPLKEWVDALTSLYAAREQAKSVMYEVTGISDIMRGQTQASETATAQRIKGQFGTLRLQDRQREMARFCKDTVAIMAEIVCGMFQPQTILEISGFGAEQNVGQAIALLKDDAMRGFRLDIETDSTLEPDRDAEKAARVEFLTAVSQFMDKAVVAGQQFPALAPLLGEFLMFGIRGFPIGRDLEQRMQETMDQLAQAAQQSQGQPSPEQQKAQADLEAAQQKAQMDAQIAMQKAQADAQSAQAKLQGEMEMARARLQLEREEMMARIQLEREKLAAEIALEREKAAADIEIKAATARMNMQARMEQPQGTA